MNDFSAYRLESPQELDALYARMGDKFMLFLNGVYRTLMNMQPGDTYEFEQHVKPVNRPVFVKIACDFIIHQQANDYEFTDNTLRVIRRLPPYQSPFKNRTDGPGLDQPITESRN